MKDKIKIGEYVRVNNDNRNCIGIGKVTRLVKESVYVNMNNKYNLPVSFQINNIVKHSEQLIDLIEVGDIVEDEYNKYEVAFVKYNKIYCNDYNLDDSLITLREQDIKAILAKEQMEANCYKVGGEDEKIQIMD